MTNAYNNPENKGENLGLQYSERERLIGGWDIKIVIDR